MGSTVDSTGGFPRWISTVEIQQTGSSTVIFTGGEYTGGELSLNARIHPIRHLAASLRFADVHR